MFEEISRAMPRFERYTEIFPESERLQHALHAIYSAYLDFAVEAVKFFSQNAFGRKLFSLSRQLCRFPLLILLAVHTLFDVLKFGALTVASTNAIDTIRRAARDFEAEATLEHAVSTNQHLTTITNALPNVYIQSKCPKRVFSVPLSRNDRFFRKCDELETLQKSLAPLASKQRSCVVHGMAGVGKTQTALQFAFQCQNVFLYIFWVRAEDEAVLADDFGKIAQQLKLLSDEKCDDLALLNETARAWLCRSMTKPSMSICHS